MLGVPVRRLIAGVRHSQVAHDEDRLRVGWVGVVVPGDRALDRSHRSGARQVGARHAPAIHAQVLLQQGQLARQRRGIGVVHEQDHPAPVINRRNRDARGDVTRAGDAPRHAHHLVLVGRAHRNTRVLIAQFGGRRGGDGGAPGRALQRLPEDGDAGCAGQRGPVERDACRRCLHRGRELHGGFLRIGLSNSGRGCSQEEEGCRDAAEGCQSVTLHDPSARPTGWTGSGAPPSLPKATCFGFAVGDITDRPSSVHELPDSLLRLRLNYPAIRFRSSGSILRARRFGAHWARFIRRAS